MTSSDLLELEHDKQVVIIGNVGVLENGCHLMLSRSYFIVASLARNTQLPEF